MKDNLKITLLSLGIVAIFVIIATLKLPDNSFLWREIHNAGHTPLFGSLSLLILGILFIVYKKRNYRRIKLYIASFIIATFLGLALEIYQIPGPGDADIVDLIRDIAGALSFLLIFSFFDKNFDYHNKKHQMGRLTFLFVGIFILFCAVLPTILWSMSFINRDNEIPTLLNFNSVWERAFIKTQSATIEILAAPTTWREGTGQVGKLTFGNGTYPGFGIAEPYPDWSDYRFLRFAVYSTLSDSINISIRIDDAHHNQKYTDRFGRMLTIAPGNNDIRINLDDIESAPKGRKMDMKKIKLVLLFGSKSLKGDSLYFDNFHLE
jgi:hypothetical protein